MMSFRVILTLFAALRGLCSLIMTFPVYPHNCTVDSLSRSPRDYLKYFEISVLRHIRFYESEESH